MKRKFLTLTILFTALASAAACGGPSDGEENPYDSSPETRTVPFESLAEEYDVEDGEIDLYFYEEGVAYVDIVPFIGLLDGAIMADEADASLEEGLFTLDYTLEADETEADIYEDTDMSLTLDLGEDTITVNRLAFFNGLSEATKTDYGEHLEVTGYTENILDPLTIDLSEYNIRAIEDDGSVRLPLNLANLFFSGSMFDTYFNGEKVYGVDTYQLMDDLTVAQTLNDSSKNSESMPRALKEHTIDYLALSFDYFYGLGLEGENSHYALLEEHESRLKGSDRLHYRAISDFLYERDDIHTSPLMNGFYEDQLEFQYNLNDLESRTRNYYETFYDDTMGAHCAAGSDIAFSGDETKALIKVDGFDEETLEAFEGAMDQIAAKGTVEDVVIDLSCNSGGVIGIMIQMLGYMTDEPIDFHSRNATDGSTSTTTYTVDIDARDYDFHLLSSPLSYSAANSMLSIAKDNDIAQVIGKDSTGGASSVMTNITPSGSVFFMSSPSIMTDSDYNSIEYGIEVDEALSLNEITDADAVFDALP